MKPALQAVPRTDEKPTVRSLVGTLADKAKMMKEAGPSWARRQEVYPVTAAPLLEGLLEKVGQSDREQDFAANTAALVNGRKK
ncbi:MAG: hypothetical protein V1827_06580 [Candidatus Micrarchaeota archaeon]